MKQAEDNRTIDFLDDAPCPRGRPRLAQALTAAQRAALPRQAAAAKAGRGGE